MERLVKLVKREIRKNIVNSTDAVLSNIEVEEETVTIYTGCSTMSETTKLFNALKKNGLEVYMFSGCIITGYSEA